MPVVKPLLVPLRDHHGFHFAVLNALGGDAIDRVALPGFVLKNQFLRRECVGITLFYPRTIFPRFIRGLPSEQRPVYLPYTYP